MRYAVANASYGYFHKSNRIPMEIELSKGGRFNLSKEAPNLKKVAIGLGCQTNQISRLAKNS
jgi:TerD domain